MGQDIEREAIRGEAGRTLPQLMRQQLGGSMGPTGLRSVDEVRLRILRAELDGWQQRDAPPPREPLGLVELGRLFTHWPEQYRREAVPLEGGPDPALGKSTGIVTPDAQVLETVEARPVLRRARRQAWALRARLRQFAELELDREREGRVLGRPMPRRFRACGRLVHGGAVEVLRDATGRASYAGPVSCGAVWWCPVCEMRIQAERADEVTRAVKLHPGQAIMATLTVSHGRGHDLRTMRRALGRAYRRMTRGEPWRRFARSIGLVGSVRALEVTHGTRGWHPHLHALWLVRSTEIDWSVPGGMVEIPGGPEPKRRHTRLSWDEWLASRWRDAVISELGQDHAPSTYHGVWLSACDDGSYLAKMGLEIAPPGSKAGRWQSRSPWQLARELVEHPSGDALMLWGDYVRGISGARRLTWSSGLRARLKLGAERSDEEIAAEREREAKPIARISVAQWNALSLMRMDGVPGPIALLEAVERGTDPIAWCAAMLRRKTSAG